MKSKIYIIGAGLSGLTSAYFLQKSNYEVEVFESSPQAGGRCRSFYDKSLGKTIDNGNHLVLGVNENILGLMGELESKNKLQKFSAEYNFYNLKNGKSFKFKPNLLNLLKIIFKLRTLVAIYNNVFESVFNTKTKQVPSNFKLKTIKNLLSKGKVGLEYYYPKTNWGDALIEPLESKLPPIKFNSAIKQIEFFEGRASKLHFNNGTEINVLNHIVILATPMHTTYKLLGLNLPQKHNTIINIHFKVAHNLTPQIIGFLHSYIDWVFIKDGIISTTKSAANDINLNDDELIAKCFASIKKAFPQLTGYDGVKIIKEKRATFACEAEMLESRPSHETGYQNLFITGDYIQNNLPATLEGCVLNAKNLCNGLTLNSKI